MIYNNLFYNIISKYHHDKTNLNEIIYFLKDEQKAIDA